MYLKKTVIPFLILGLFFGSCREALTEQKAYLYNNTDVNVKILHFTNGVVLPDDTIKLNPGDEFVYAESSHRGRVNTPMFGSKYAVSSEDSVVVVFNDTYRVVHYVDAPEILSNPHYLYESTRNLGNRFSYDFTHKKRGNARYINIHKYYFTEDDYNFAKE